MQQKNRNTHPHRLLKGAVFGPLLGLVCISPFFEKPYIGLLYGFGIGLLIDLFLYDKYAK